MKNFLILIGLILCFSFLMWQRNVIRNWINQPPNQYYVSYIVFDSDSNDTGFGGGNFSADKIDLEMIEELEEAAIGKAMEKLKYGSGSSVSILNIFKLD